MSKLAVLSASLAVTLGALPAWSSAMWCEDGTYTWKVSVLPDRIAGVCDGGRGFVRVEGNELAYFIEGSRTPAWVVDLRPDGSAETAYGAYIHRQIRIKVVAGTGPREITSLNERWMCDFKFIPD